MICGNLRLIVENYVKVGSFPGYIDVKYGFLLQVPLSGVPTVDFRISLILLTLIPAHLFISLWIEVWAAHKARRIKSQNPKATMHRKGSWGFIRFAHIVNVSICLAVTSVTVYTRVYHPLLGILCEVHAGTRHPWMRLANSSYCCIESCFICPDESRFKGYVP